MKFLNTTLLSLGIWGGLWLSTFPANAELILPPKPNGMVVDEADILTTEQETEIDVDLQAFDLQTSVQIVLVTVADLQGYEPQQFALELGRAWGVGQDQVDNGLIFLVAPNDRLVRIEVGYGLEGAIPDALASQILETYVTPEFAEARYFEGIQSGLTQLKQAAQGDYPIQLEPESKTETDLGGLILFGVYLAFSVLASSRSWWLGGVVGGIAGAIIAGLVGALVGVGIGLLIDFIVSKYIGPHLRNGGGSGGHFLGGSGGGFGGFGGGSFGGGGASGRW